MAKIFFRYGAMNSSKTAQALMVAHNYKERGQNVLFYKPSIDNREGVGAIIKSRCGIETKDVILFNTNTNLYADVLSKKSHDNIHCILVDESQFLTKDQVIQLSNIVDEYNIPVICYGLRTNFKGELFTGSQYLLTYADSIEEIKTICWCGKKAIMNARVIDGKVTKEGTEIQIGGNESYTSLCRMHWKNGILKH